LYYEANIVCGLALRRMRLARHMARRGENRNTYRFWRGGLKERDGVGDVGLDGKRISELFLMWRGMD
jgi:hypothetical protein